MSAFIATGHRSIASKGRSSMRYVLEQDRYYRGQLSALNKQNGVMVNSGLKYLHCEPHLGLCCHLQVTVKEQINMYWFYCIFMYWKWKKMICHVLHEQITKWDLTNTCIGQWNIWLNIPLNHSVAYYITIQYSCRRSVENDMSMLIAPLSAI